MDKNKILAAFTDYAPRHAPDEECLPFLEEGKDLVLGLRFTDPAVNFTLLTPNDLEAFPPPMAQRIVDARRSPFDDLLLLFYEMDGAPGWKLVGGMAGRLLAIADTLCEG